MLKIAVILIALLPFFSAAEDLGFRYNGSACVDKNGNQGLNPSFFGQCGDMRHLTVRNANFDGTDFSGAVFDGADFQMTSFNGATLSYASFVGTDLTGCPMTNALIQSTNFSKAILVNVHFAGANIQSSNFSGTNLSGIAFSTMTLTYNSFKGANMSGAALDGADLSGSDLTSANLKGANCQSGKLSGATLDHADFTGANLTGASLTSATGSLTIFKTALLRQANLTGAKLLNANMHGAQMDQAKLNDGDFRNSDLGHASLPHADLTGANLSGVRIDRITVLPIDSSTALSLGMTIDTTVKLFVIYDGTNDTYLLPFLASLDKLGVDTIISPEDHATFKGDVDLTEYDAVLHLNANEYSSTMPAAGQTALVSFVQGGGVLINTGSVAYGAANGYLTQMKDLALLTYTGASNLTNVALTPPANTASPVLNGMTFPLTVTSWYVVTGKLVVFTNNPSTVLLNDPNMNPVLVQRDLGAGHVIEMAACYPGSPYCLGDSNIATIVANASIWDTSSMTPAKR